MCSTLLALSGPEQLFARNGKSCKFRKNHAGDCHVGGGQTCSEGTDVHQDVTRFAEMQWIVRKPIVCHKNHKIFMKITDFHENHTFPWKSLIFPGKPLFGHENHNISTEITIFREKANFHENHTFP